MTIDWQTVRVIWVFLGLFLVTAVAGITVLLVVTKYAHWLFFKLAGSAGISKEGDT